MAEAQATGIEADRPAVVSSMVTGMASTQKVTVTLQIEQVEAIRALVTAGKSESVSGFVQHAVALALDDVSGWAALLQEALEQTGGPATADEQAWAEGVLSRGSVGGDGG